MATLASFALSFRWLDATDEMAVTVSFLTLAFAQLWNVFNMRDPASRMWRNDITLNPWVRLSLLLCAGLILAAVYIPWLASVLSLQIPGIREWALIAGCSLIPLVTGQVIIVWRKAAGGR